MGNTCTPVADSCQCMAKPLPNCKVPSLQLKSKSIYIKKYSHREISEESGEAGHEKR